MWCFFDESHVDSDVNVTAISACLMGWPTIRDLDIAMYRARRKHFGEVNAQSLDKELKGGSLFASNSFKMVEKYNSSKNLDLATDLFDHCIKSRTQHPIHLFGAVVYGQSGILKHLDASRLSRPISDVLDKVSAAAQIIAPDEIVHLVFDSQICGDEHNIAGCVRRFVFGVKLHNVSHFPLVGISHVSPGIQLADICAHLLGRHAKEDDRIKPWYDKMMQMQWEGWVNEFKRRGVQSWEKNSSGEFVVRPA